MKSILKFDQTVAKQLPTGTKVTFRLQAIEALVKGCTCEAKGAFFKAKPFQLFGLRTLKSIFDVKTWPGRVRVVVGVVTLISCGAIPICRPIYPVFEVRKVLASRLGFDAIREWSIDQPGTVKLRIKRAISEKFGGNLPPEQPSAHWGFDQLYTIAHFEFKRFAALRFAFSSNVWKRPRGTCRFDIKLRNIRLAQDLGLSRRRDRNERDHKHEADQFLPPMFVGAA